MRLWARASSVNVQKVLWALEEYGELYEHRIVGGRYGGLDDPAFDRLTPTGKVPVLEDGPVAVWESNAILRYLGRKHMKHPLSQSIDRADPWMDFGTATLQPPFIGLFWQMVRMRPEESSEGAISSQREKLSQALDVIDNALATESWLAGDIMSLADIAVGTPFYRLKSVAPDLLKERPQINAWMQQLEGRVGWKSHVDTSFDELRPT